MTVALGYVFKTGYLNIPLEAMFFIILCTWHRQPFSERKYIMTIASMMDETATESYTFGFCLIPLSVSESSA